MEIQRKLEILADAAKYDASCASSGVKRKNSGDGLGNSSGVGICHSYTPDGRCISLLKILLTNECIYDCQYCINRLSSSVPRARFTTREVVWLTIEFYRRNYIEGLFLSSGIIRSADYTMHQLAEVARSLREEESFNGYIHLKAVPGASGELLDLAGRYADRLSANIELATQSDLDELAPAKTVDDVENTMSTIRERHAESREERKKSKKAPKFSPAGQTTQMIVGATKSPDRSLLATADRLYQRHKLKRVYYSAFSPIPDSSAELPSQSPPLVREHRLYQADWLIRFYGFDVEELTTDQSPDLPLDIDPKLAWALSHREFFPVDVNRASREELLRVPGLGTRGVQNILKMRRHRRVSLCELKKIRVSIRRAGPFIEVSGPNPYARSLESVSLRNRFSEQPKQLSLFGEQQASAR